MTSSTPGATPLSRTSSRVVAARKLSRRRVRDERRCFTAEGPQAIAEAVRCADVVTELFATPEALRRHTGLAAEAERNGAQVRLVDDAALTSLAETVQPQGLVAVCRFVDTALPDPVRLVAVLDNVGDPGNAGTILRTADAAGADAVVFPHGAVDSYNGKCVRASAGSLFHLPVVRGGATAEHLDTLRRAGLRILATDVRGGVDLDDAVDAGLLDAPSAWVFGSEAHGLSAELARDADERVRVPIHGACESLNLATAAAVCLYASARQHRKGRVDELSGRGAPHLDERKRRSRRGRSHRPSRSHARADPCSGRLRTAPPPSGMDVYTARRQRAAAISSTLIAVSFGGLTA